MNIRFDDSILQDFGDLCSTFFSSTPMFSIEPSFLCLFIYFALLRTNAQISVEPCNDMDNRASDKVNKVFIGVARILNNYLLIG